LSDLREQHAVIPAKAGIQLSFLGSRFRGNDGGGKQESSRSTLEYLQTSGLPDWWPIGHYFLEWLELAALKGKVTVSGPFDEKSRVIGNF
jgi:hypothetical protein